MRRYQATAWAARRRRLVWFWRPPAGRDRQMPATSWRCQKRRDWLCPDPTESIAGASPNCARRRGDAAPAAHVGRTGPHRAGPPPARYRRSTPLMVPAGPGCPSLAWKRRAASTELCQGNRP